MSAMFDVIEVEIEVPHRIRVLDRSKSEANAEAIVKFAVWRRGVESHFYKTVPAGQFNDGDFLP
jgi:hypothetical protein